MRTRRARARVLLGSAGASALLTGLTWCAGTAAPLDVSAPVKDVAVQLGGTPSSAEISWFARGSAGQRVQYVVRPTDGRWPARVNSVPATARRTAEARWTGESARLTGLRPGVSYLYRVGSATGGWSPVRSVTVPRVGSGPVLAFVDPQLRRRGSVVDGAAGWASTVAAATRRHPEARFLVSLGDQVNDPTHPDEWDAFYAPGALGAHRLATIPGNHDVARSSAAYRQHVALPNPSPAGDWTSREGDVLVVGLNSNVKTVSTHTAHLSRAVAANRTARWTVVLMHHAPFSGGDHMDDADVQRLRSSLTPEFSRLGVDLVLSGHDHGYVRTHLMTGASATTRLAGPGAEARPRSGEVLYLTLNSSSGNKFYRLERPMPWQAVRSQGLRPTYTAVTTTPTSLSATTYDDRGRVVDAITLRH